jgi:hypothetical protein
MNGQEVIATTGILPAKVHIHKWPKSERPRAEGNPRTTRHTRILALFRAFHRENSVGRQGHSETLDLRLLSAIECFQVCLEGAQPRPEPPLHVGLAPWQD